MPDVVSPERRLITNEEAAQIAAGFIGPRQTGMNLIHSLASRPNDVLLLSGQQILAMYGVIERVLNENDVEEYEYPGQVETEMVGLLRWLMFRVSFPIGTDETFPERLSAVLGEYSYGARIVLGLYEGETFVVHDFDRAT